MVRAILDGRKTCTRRIVKGFIPNDAVWGYTAFTPKRCISCRGTFADGYGEKFFKLPYQPGDILYVRETIWQKVRCYLDVNRETQGVFCHEYRYVATDKEPETGWNFSWVKRPSIHMPKEAARIWLKVTDVRVERLQEITETQAQSEGCNSGLLTGACTARGQFEDLWNSTIKKSDLDYYGWSANPWVWVIEFERCEAGGIDEK
jgi:hypothetical protein